MITTFLCKHAVIFQFLRGIVYGYLQWWFRLILKDKNTLWTQSSIETFEILMLVKTQNKEGTFQISFMFISYKEESLETSDRKTKNWLF